MLEIIELYFDDNVYSNSKYLNSLYKINNYFEKIFNILIITIASIGEEIIYRGFLQNYVNQFFNDFRVISRGNIFASTLFWITHLGFFTIMEPLFAAMSLFLVAVSSLTLGYLKDKSNGIILPIIVHLICNYIHTFIKISLG